MMRLTRSGRNNDEQLFMLLVVSSLFHSVYLKNFPCLSSQQRVGILARRRRFPNILFKLVFSLYFDSHET